MGRPSLGDQARNIQKGTKLSKDEIRWLEGLHGSAGKGLRVALAHYKVAQMQASGLVGAEQYVEPVPVEDEPVWVPPQDYRPIVDVELPDPVPLPTGPRPVVPVDAEGTPIPCRIHRKWETIDEYFDKGVAMREKRCVKCGRVVVARAS